MPTEAGLARIAEEAAQRDAFDRDRVLSPGDLSPRARIAALCDDSTFFEIGALARSHHPDAREQTFADGVITGFGRSDGREVALIVEDAVALASSDGAVGRNKRLKLLSHALQAGCPIVSIFDGAGPAAFATPGRLLGGYSEMLGAGAELDLEARRAPLITVVAGRCEGPDALAAVGADVLIATREGVASSPHLVPDLVCADDRAALQAVRRLLALIPARDGAALETLASEDPSARLHDEVDPARLAADEVLDGLLDAGAVRFDVAGATRVCVGAVEGRVAVFAFAGGGLGSRDLDAIDRAARLSARFHVPFLAISHGAAYDIGAQAPGVGSLAAAVATLHASEAPKLALITRSGHTLGNFVLGGRELGFDYIAAWPLADVGTADVPVYDTAVRDAEAGTGPWAAAGAGLIDDVLAPSESRARLARLLDVLAPSRGLPSAKGAEGGRLIYR